MDNSDSRCYVRSLYDLGMKYVVNNLSSMAVGYDFPVSPSRLKLREGVVLPAQICDDFFSFYQYNQIVDDDVLGIFDDTRRTKLQRVKIKLSPISGQGLSIIMQHKPVHVELTDCVCITPSCFDIISANSECLNSLTVRFSSMKFREDLDENWNYIFAPKLQRLTIQNCLIDLHQTFTHSTELSYLNLTGYDKSGLSAITLLNNLTHLILHDADVEPVIDVICSIHTLQYLDLSQPLQTNIAFCDPDNIVTKILEGLPALGSLDVSGTNLFTHQSQSSNSCNNPTWETRADNPLKFLGICSQTCCYVCKATPLRGIPALEIASLNHIDQILVAARVYRDCLGILNHVMVELFQYFEDGIKNNNIQEAFQVALPTFFDLMEYHIRDVDFQQICCGTLYTVEEALLRNGDVISVELQKRMITLIISTMQIHDEDEYIIRTGCQIFPVIGEMIIETLYEYDRLVLLLLHIIAHTTDVHVLRNCIPMFLTLTSKIDFQTKLLIADIGILKSMLRIMSEHLIRGTCDAILMITWVAMSNFTNGVPENCNLFINLDGLQYFVQCAQNYPSQVDLLIPMTGVVSNLSKMPHLRMHLKTKSVLRILQDLLSSPQDTDRHVTMKYNVLEAIAYLASDGVEKWIVYEPSCEEILTLMVNTISSLSYDVLTHVKYESLIAILNMLKNCDVPQCLYWAVWAIGHLLHDNAVYYILSLAEGSGFAVIDDVNKSMKTKIADNHNVGEDGPSNVYQNIVDIIATIKDTVKQNLTPNMFVTMPRELGQNLRAQTRVFLNLEDCD